jgi:hypothetical protein
MVEDARNQSIVLLESNPLVQTRVARILSAHSGFAPVHCIEDVIEAADAVHGRTRLLVFPDVELDLAVHYATERKGLTVAIVNKEITAPVLDAMERSEAFSHLLSWPDFLPIPRSWDLATAARCAVSAAPGCSWQDIVPASSAHIQWPLYSSFDRDLVMERLGDLVRTSLLDDRIADAATEVAYEMAMNAMYDAPVDADGHPKYAQDRQQDIALEDHEVPTLTFASDGSVLVLQIDDYFGRLKRTDVLEGIRRGLGARTADSSYEILNTRQGGAGLGLFRMFQLATSLMFDVVNGQYTRVVAVIDLNLRVRDRRTFPTSLHLFFR